MDLEAQLWKLWCTFLFSPFSVNFWINCRCHSFSTSFSHLRWNICFPFLLCKIAQPQLDWMEPVGKHKFSNLAEESILILSLHFDWVIHTLIFFDHKISIVFAVFAAGFGLLCCSKTKLCLSSKSFATPDTYNTFFPPALSCI